MAASQAALYFVKYNGHAPAIASKAECVVPTRFARRGICLPTEPVNALGTTRATSWAQLPPQRLPVSRVARRQSAPSRVALEHVAPAGVSCAPPPVRPRASRRRVANEERFMVCTSFPRAR